MSSLDRQKTTFLGSRATAWSPATVANLNVGFDALGLALESPQERMFLEVGQSSGVEIVHQYALDLKGQEVPINLPRDAEANVAGRSALSALQAIQKSIPHTQELGVSLTIEKSILPGSGIGSSAASACAAAVGVNGLFGSPLSDDELLECALDGEELASGARHLDNVAPAMRGGLCLNTPRGEIISLPPPEWTLVILHPQVEVKTSSARAVLPSHVPIAQVSQAAAWMGSFVSACFAQDARAAALSLHDLYVGPARADLIPRFEQCKAAAMRSGALSGGISGSGPSTFWVCLSERHAQEVERALLQEMSDAQLQAQTHISAIHRRGAYALLQPQ